MEPSQFETRTKVFGTQLSRDTIEMTLFCQRTGDAKVQRLIGALSPVEQVPWENQFLVWRSALMDRITTEQVETVVGTENKNVSDKETV